MVNLEGKWTSVGLLPVGSSNTTVQSGVTRTDRHCVVFGAGITMMDHSFLQVPTAMLTNRRLHALLVVVVDYMSMRYLTTS